VVYVGKAKGDPHENAVALLRSQGYEEAPGVALLMAHNQKRIEVVTSAAGSLRLSNDACARVIGIMRPALQNADWVGAIELGLAAICEEAGPGKSPSSEEQLPNLLQ